MLERARALIPLWPSGRRPRPRRGKSRPRRSPNIMRPVSCASCSPGALAASRQVQPVLADRRGTDLWLRLVGLGLCGLGRASMDHRAVSRTAQIDVWGEDPLAVASSSLAPREAARRVPAAGGSAGITRSRAAATMRNGRSSAPFSAKRATRATRLPAGAARRGRDLDDWRVLGLLAPAASPWSCTTSLFPSTAWSWSATSLPEPRRARWCIPTTRCCARRAAFWCPTHCRRSHRVRPARPRPRVRFAGAPGVARGDAAGGVRNGADGDRRGRRGDRRRDAAPPHRARLQHRGVSSGRKITEAEALRARRDMVYAQHQVGWALDRLCETRRRPLGL